MLISEFDEKISGPIANVKRYIINIPVEMVDDADIIQHIVDAMTGTDFIFSISESTAYILLDSSTTNMVDVDATLIE